jgi:exosome complex component RRP45
MFIQGSCCENDLLCVYCYSLSYRNLVDAANVAALAALMTFRRPDCTVGGDNSQDVIIHPPEEREPLPLIIHHLPIAFTFGFFNKGSILVKKLCFVY